jgi:Tol biopolymer transport system component
MQSVVQPGSRLGPYEIVSPLGSGGMGEVYRARDPRLGRDVAIKVLPDTIANDPERLHRFEEEARAASALSHPNIVTVHEIGREGDQRFLVMELVEGETLRARLENGPLSLREAFHIGAQVASGLAAAHAKGIVHRDLKPANVVVTREGIAKILDFGLARRSVLPPVRPGDTHVVRKLATEPGLVVGTAEYMSPEQVRGDIVDSRSDLFSFGTLFYEMLTGRMPFLRGSPADTMAAILMEEPQDLPSLVPGLPSSIERIVRRCLEKNPERRFQSAKDLAFALEGLPWSSSSARTLAMRAVPNVVGGASNPEAPIIETATAPVAGRRLRPALAVALLIALAGASLLAFWVGRRSAPLSEPIFRRLTFSRGAIRSARFSPDGRTVVYGAAWNGEPIRLFTTQAESPESRRLEFADGDILAVSPKGEMAISLGHRYLTLHLGIGTLARAPIAGQAPREVLERVQEADWAPDSESLGVVRDVEGRNRLEFPIGKVLYETAGWLSHPRISPTGDEVALIEHPLRWDDQGAVIVVSRSGKKRLVSGTWQSAGGLAWGPEGREIWFTAAPAGAGRALHAITPGGRERIVLRVSGNITLQDIHRNGRVLLSDDKWRRRLFFRGADAPRETELTWLDWSYPRGVSADFSKLLFDEAGDGGGKDYAVYLRSTGGGPAVHLGRGNGLALSPDGRWALTATVQAPAQLVLLPTGAGEPRQLAGGSIDHRVASFLPDGKRILFGGSEPPKRQRLFVQDLAGGSPVPVTPEGTTFADGVTVPISPDGLSVLVSGPDGSVSIIPIAGGPARPLGSLLGGDTAIGWGVDSHSLFVVRPGELPAKVSRLDLDSGRRTPWREILPADPAGTAAINPILIRPDGSAYVYGTPQILSDLYVVDGLR